MLGGVLSCTDDLISVIVTRAHPGSHHRMVLSLVKCRLFMDISWECWDEVILAGLWLVLLELSSCPDPPSLNDDHRGPPRAWWVSIRSAQSLNELDGVERRRSARARSQKQSFSIIAFNYWSTICGPKTVQTKHTIVLLLSLLAL